MSLHHHKSNNPKHDTFNSPAYSCRYTNPGILVSNFHHSFSRRRFLYSFLSPPVFHQRKYSRLVRINILVLMRTTEWSSLKSLSCKYKVGFIYHLFMISSLFFKLYVWNVFESMFIKCKRNF